MEGLLNLHIPEPSGELCIFIIHMERTIPVSIRYIVL